MRSTRPFNVLIVHGSRIIRLDVSRRVIAVLTTLVLAMASLQAFVVMDDLALRRRSADLAMLHQSTSRQLSIDVAALAARESEQRVLEVAVERSIVTVTAELARWDDVEQQIRRAMARVPQRDRPPGSLDGRAQRISDDDPNAPLPDRLDRLVTSIRDEGQTLRALGRLMIHDATILAALPSRWPLLGPVSSEFGHRVSPWSNAAEFHEGVDIRAETGTSVRAPAPGIVVEATRVAGYGTTLVIEHAQHVRTRFAHLQAIRVARGQRVERGDVVAVTGNTGRSTGPHLHYEVLVDGHPVNPRAYVWE